MAIILCMTVAIAPPVLAAGGATDYSSLRQYYANNPQPALSNQSLVFDQQGRIVQVVTGKPGSATVVPAAGATIVPGLRPSGAAGVPAATVTPAVNATGGTLTASVTAVPPTATPTVVPTRTRSPGFGIILSAMAILGVLFYLNRKK
jgi:hypothetical protein